MKIKIGEIKQLIHSILKESLLEEPNYQLTNYELEDYDIDGRFFNVILDFNSEDGMGGINITSVVETFDPSADADLGGPPEDIKEKYLLNQLPSDWTFRKGFLEKQVSRVDFLNLLIKSSKLESLYDQLYEAAKTLKHEEIEGDW